MLKKVAYSKGYVRDHFNLQNDTILCLNQAIADGID